MAIGDAWEEGSWIDAGYVVGAWQIGAAAVTAFVSRVSIGISIGIHGFMLVIGRAVLGIGGWW